MRIAIFGQYKTGTTALFYAVRRACPAGIRCLFEPRGYEELPTDRLTGVLAKIIIDSTAAYEFTGFDRKVLIVRDPRDWLISEVLFMPQQREAIYRDGNALAEIVRLLRQKERQPSAISMRQLMETVLGFLAESERGHAAELIRGQLDFTSIFAGRLRNGMRIKYEDFVEGALTELEEYLDLSLDHRVTVPDFHGHVPRTLTHDNWRTWFTPEDVDYYRPLMRQFMEILGYPDDWSLEPATRLDPNHGSRYVERTVAMRRVGMGQPSETERPETK